MTELAITPKWKDKEAKFRGVVAAGEHVAVTIQNDDGSGNAFISDTETLRLNVIDPTSGRLLATFPTPVEDGETPETWSESGTQLSCELNLNTVQMLKAVLPASVASILFVLDDYENKTLYFKAQHEVAHWPRRRGEEEPLNLDGYKDIIRVFGLRLTAVEETATSAAASAASAATSSATSAQAAAAAAAAATGSQGSAANSATAAETARNEAETARDEAKEYAESAESVLANAATKGALQAEVERAKTAEQNLANEISEVGNKVDTVVGGDTGKSARTIAAEEVAKVVASAPADFDTLKEIAAYIESDKIGAAQMVANIDANTKSISAEVKRAKDAESALAGRVKTLEDTPPAVEVVAPSPDGAGKAADAMAVHDALEGKRDKTDLAVYTVAFSDWTIVDSANTGFSWDIEHVTPEMGAERDEWWLNETAWGSAGVAILPYDAMAEKLVFTVIGDLIGFDEDVIVTCTRKKTFVLADGKILTSADGVLLLPRYLFVDAAIADGAVTVTPYTNTKLTSDGTAFSVAVGGESGYMRDCVLVVECGETAPPITWPSNFHPRTDAETDFACVAGVRNVYWIAEYASGEFCVAGWQETDGGGTSGGGNAQ